MDLVYYLLFLIISVGGLMIFFQFTTYHAYFFKALPPLLGYSILSGYLLFLFGLNSFFIWHLISVSAVLVPLWFIANRRAKVFTKVLGDGNPPMEALFKLSLASTRAHYILTALVYLLAFSTSYLTFYNLRSPLL